MKRETGRAAYNAYCAWLKAVKGERLPRFSDQPQHQQAAWQAVADSVQG
jgi:hypothetical protein